LYSRDTVVGRYGIGKPTAQGDVNPLLIQCAVFPSADLPVLASRPVEIQDRVQHRARILFIEGFAADGVSELRLVGSSGQILARAPVVSNVFSMEKAAGLQQAGTTLVAVDDAGHTVWSQA
jgi:hypothetical protein